MPTYKITGPDGTVYRVTGDGSAEEALAQVQAKLGVSAEAPTAKEPEEKTKPTTAEKIAANPFVRLAVGAAEPIQGAVQRMSEKGFGSAFPLLSFAAKMARPTLDESFAETKKMAKAGGHTGTDFMGIFGNMMSPAALVAGKAGIPASLLGKTALGASVGAAGGALAPAENEDAARKNALIGAAVGGVLPPALVGGAKAVEGASNALVRPMADLFTKQGPTNILNRYIRGDKVVGEKNMPAVIAAVRNVDPILPGGKPTVADAVAGVPAGSPLQALQEISAKTGGGNSARFYERALEQRAAVDAAKAARKAESTANYGRAFDAAVNKINGDPELAQLASNPFFKDAMPAALKLADAKGLTAKNNLTEILHDVKLGLDRKLKGGIGEEALSAAQYKEIASVKEKLVEWLAKKNPDYETGRAAHSKASKLIDAYTARQELAAKPLQSTSLGGGINIGEETRPHLPNLLSRPAMLANWAMRKAGSGIEPKVDKALADLMLDPTKFADEMSKLPPKTRIDIEKWLRRSNELSAGIGQAQ